MRLAGIFFLILLIISCKTKQPLLMSEAEKVEKKAAISSFFIPILLSKTDLERALNERIDGKIFDDKISDGNLQISVNKVDSITISLKDTTLLYRVPLHIFVKKEMLLTDVAAEGDIALDFETHYTLNTDWTITTLTKLVKHEWIKEPKAQVLGFKIPVTSIAERVLINSSKKVTDAIDKQVNESFALKEYAAQAWNILQEPILVSEDYNSRFKFTPTGLAISPFKTKKDTIISTLFVQGNTQVGVGEKTNFTANTPLLPLQIKDFDKGGKFSMNLISEIPFEEAEKVALKNFKGEEYGFGKKKVIIEDIQLEKAGKNMLIRAKTKGDYKGWLNLKGIPAYNKKKNHIEIKDIEFSLDTKNFLMKSAKWLFNGLIVNKLEGSLVYPLEEDLAFIEAEIQKQLSDYKIQEGISLNGAVKKLEVKEAFLKDESIMLGVNLEGAVKILIKAIP